MFGSALRVYLPITALRCPTSLHLFHHASPPFSTACEGAYVWRRLVVRSLGWTLHDHGVGGGVGDMREVRSMVFLDPSRL